MKDLIFIFRTSGRTGVRFNFWNGTRVRDSAEREQRPHKIESNPNSGTLTHFVQMCTILSMKIGISEARKRLPELVRRVRRDGGGSVQITLHDEVVAELRAPLTDPQPGAAARKLLELARKLPKPRGSKTNISSHVKDHLYRRRSSRS